MVAKNIVVCVFLISNVLLPAVLFSQKDSLAKAFEITGFRMHQKGRYKKDTIIYLTNQPDIFFEKLNVISLNEALKIVRTQRHFKKSIDNYPDLLITDSLNPRWMFNSTHDIIYIYKLRVRNFYISLDAKTGKVQRRNAHRYWFRSPPHIKHL